MSFTSERSMSVYNFLFFFTFLFFSFLFHSYYLLPPSFLFPLFFFFCCCFSSLTVTSSAYLSLLSILEIPSSRENYEGKRELRIPGIIRVIATLYVYISLSLFPSRYRSLRPYAFRDTRRQNLVSRRKTFRPFFFLE